MIAPEATRFFAVQGIQNFDGFDEPARKAIARESALALFPHFSG